MSYYPGQQTYNGPPYPGGGYGPPQGPPPGGYPPHGYQHPTNPTPQQQYQQYQQYPSQGYTGYPPQAPSPQPNYYQPPQHPPQAPQHSPQPQQYGPYQPPTPHTYAVYSPSQAPVPPPSYAGRPGLPSVHTNSFVHGNPNAPPPPPQGAQAFGTGSPHGYSFQYSACNGKRKALLIGINYFNQRGELKGCINDVKNMSTYLNQNFGYAREDMVMLTDDQTNPMSMPTKANILRAMHWLVKDAKPNDSLFFHFSGHGGQTEDQDGDEDDGYDEVIYPCDFRTAGHIVDDEMHRIMVKPLAPGVRLTAIFDSCHSGSALDLPYIYSTQGVIKEPNLVKEAGQGLLGMVTSYGRGDIGGVATTAASTALGIFKKATRGDSQAKAIRTKTSPADVIMWSGSKDSQTSQDAHISGEATGAMSWAFITALKKNPQQSYVQLLNSIRDELSTRYSQKPQLSCSHPLNVNLLYVM